MQVNGIHLFQRTAFKNHNTSVKPERENLHAHDASQTARDEINAFIAIRNILLAEAEKSPTSKAIESAAIANDLVEDCLQNSRSPYEAQCLPRTDAMRERKVCGEVKQRIAQLRAVIAA